MSDTKLVIEVPENYYNDLMSLKLAEDENLSYEMEIIRNGTPTIGSYEQGYNAAKIEIALSGEYERAYQRGFHDALKRCTNRLKVLNTQIKEKSKEEEK